MEVSLHNWTDVWKQETSFTIFFKSHNYASFLLYAFLLPDAKSLDLGQFISTFVDKRFSFHVSEARICFLENHAIEYL